MAIRKKVIKVTVIYDDETNNLDDIDNTSLKSIDYQITEGGCIGKVEVITDDIIPKLDAAVAIEDMDGDPDFILGEGFMDRLLDKHLDSFQFDEDSELDEDEQRDAHLSDFSLQNLISENNDEEVFGDDEDEEEDN